MGFGGCRWQKNAVVAQFGTEYGTAYISRGPQFPGNFLQIPANSKSRLTANPHLPLDLRFPCSAEGQAAEEESQTASGNPSHDLFTSRRYMSAGRVLWAGPGHRVAVAGHKASSGAEYWGSGLLCYV